MKVKFEIHSTLLQSIKTLCDDINKNMKDFGYDKKILVGFRVGEVSVELPVKETKESIRLKLEKAMNESVEGQRIWLKEAKDEKNIE